MYCVHACRAEAVFPSSVCPLGCPGTWLPDTGECTSHPGLHFSTQFAATQSQAPWSKAGCRARQGSVGGSCWKILSSESGCGLTSSSAPIFLSPSSLFRRLLASLVALSLPVVTVQHQQGHALSCPELCRRGMVSVLPLCLLHDHSTLSLGHSRHSSCSPGRLTRLCLRALVLPWRPSVLLYQTSQ